MKFVDNAATALGAAGDEPDFPLASLSATSAWCSQMGTHPTCYVTRRVPHIWVRHFANDVLQAPKKRYVYVWQCVSGYIFYENGWHKIAGSTHTNIRFTDSVHVVVEALILQCINVLRVILRDAFSARRPKSKFVEEEMGRLAAWHIWTFTATLYFSPSTL